MQPSGHCCWECTRWFTCVGALVMLDSLTDEEDFCSCLHRLVTGDKKVKEKQATLTQVIRGLYQVRYYCSPNCMRDSVLKEASIKKKTENRSDCCTAL